MKYDIYEEFNDFSLTKKKKKQFNCSVRESKKLNKSKNQIYTSKHIRKTISNLNKKNAKK
jgi:hypothetical protein